MKKTLTIIIMVAVIAIIAVCCINRPVEKPMNEKIANIIGTKSERPLDQTIWEFNTGEEFNQYLYFDVAEAKFFYGKFDTKEGLLRYTDFYSAAYELIDGKIQTNIEYPNYGDTEKVNNMDVIIVDNVCQITYDEQTFNLTQYDPADIQEQWVEFTIVIGPWSQDE